MSGAEQYAGSTVTDLLRRRKAVDQETILKFADAVLKLDAPHHADLPAARFESSGEIRFPARSIDRSEPDFCRQLGFTLNSLATGALPEPSWLLDGLRPPAGIQWRTFYFMNRLASPAPTRRIRAISDARSLLARSVESAAAVAATDTQPILWRGNAQRTGAFPGIPRPSGMAIRFFRQLPEMISAPVHIPGGFVLVAMTSGRIAVLDVETGEQAFEAPISAPTESTPAIAFGRVFIGADDGSVAAIDLATAQHIWKRKIGAMVRSSPLLVDARVYATTIDAAGRGSLACLDAANGKPIWTYRAGEAFSSPASDGHGAVVFGSDDGNVHSVDATTGRKRWTYKTGAKVRATPACANGSIHIGSFDGAFHCLDLDGSLRWKRETGKPYFSSAAVSTKLVVCGSHDSTLYALDAASGEIRWKHEMDGPVVSSPIIAGDTVICAATGGLVSVLTLDGATLSSIDIGKTIRATPLLVGSTLFVGHESGLTAIALT